MGGGVDVILTRDGDLIVSSPGLLINFILKHHKHQVEEVNNDQPPPDAPPRGVVVEVEVGVVQDYGP